MKREDYERQGPPQHAPKMYAMQFVGGTITEIATVSQGAHSSPPTHVGLMVEVNGLSSKVMIHLDKETADEVIRALIAGRNHLWPTP